MRSTLPPLTSTLQPDYHDVPKERRAAGGRMAPPQVNERVLMKWEEFYAALNATKGTETYYYMQLAVAARSGGIASDPSAGVSTRVSPRVLDDVE